MTDAALKYATRDIVIDEVFPHAPEAVWKTLTTGALMQRWITMEPIGFEPVVGNRFTFQTTPAGAWDGVIHGEVLECVENQRFVWAWRGGHASNEGYGSRLDTVVTMTLSKVEGGTRLHLVHAGFELPRNQSAYTNMSQGWSTVLGRVEAITAEQDGAKPH